MWTRMKLKLRPRLIEVRVKCFLFWELDRVRIRITYGHHITNVNRDKSHHTACQIRSLSLKLFILPYLTSVCNRLPRTIKNYRPKGRSNQRRPLKRLLGVWPRNGSRNGPTPWYLDDDDDDDDDDDEWWRWYLKIPTWRPCDAETRPFKLRLLPKTE